MKRKIVLAICLALAVLVVALVMVQVVHAPVHWGGGRIDISPHLI